MHSLFTSFLGSGTFAKNGSTDPALIYRVVSRELKKYCWLQNLECNCVLIEVIYNSSVTLILYATR